jgi:hypothetical protein|tara:strand:- start:1412 stop:1606 length:195 start_codon:yes stop_codon:yes gene_type:complete
MHRAKVWATGEDAGHAIADHRYGQYCERLNEVVVDTALALKNSISDCHGITPSCDSTLKMVRSG